MQGLTALFLPRQFEIIRVVQKDMYQVFTRERMFYFRKLSEDILCILFMDAKVDKMYRQPRANCARGTLQPLPMRTPN